MVGHAVDEATGRTGREARQERRLRPRRRRPRLGQPRPRLPDGAAAAAHARGDRGAPSRAAARALREHPHVGWLLVRSAEHGAVVLGAERRALPRRGPRRGRGPARARSPPPRRSTCCARTASSNVADIMVGSFYDPTLDEGCAFEELISFHGGLGGPQTRPFILAPPSARAADGADHRRRRGARPSCASGGWR